MTYFEEFKNMDIDTLARWIDKNGLFDNSPWLKWWDKNYCSKCESIRCEYADCKEKLGIEPFYERSLECSYCELEGHCKYFPELDYVIDSVDIIKMWLKSNNEE